MQVNNELYREIDYTFPSNTEFIKYDGNLKIKKEQGKATIYYANERHLARALLLLKTLEDKQDVDIEDKTGFNELCFMIDCSRNGVLNIPTVKKVIRNIAMLGYTSMMLYTEDTYEVDGEPVFGYLRGRYSKEEMKEVDLYAKQFGIEMIPCIQTLAHLQALRRWYVPYEDMFDIDDILMCGDERVYAFIENMFKTLSECYTSRRIHIGMDEAHNVGRGQYLDKNGYHKTFDILSEHLKRVCEIAKKYGYHVILWSDMFWKIAMQITPEDKRDKAVIPKEVLDKVPDNASVSHWDYGFRRTKAYEHKFKMHKGFKNPVWMAVSSYKCNGLLPANGLSVHHFDTAFKMVEKYGMKNLINCSWGDGGTEASLFSILPAIVDFSARAYGNTNAQMKAQFKALTGYSYSDFRKIDWPDTFCNKYDKDNVSVTKVMLYNDLFLGQLDTEVKDGDKDYLIRALKAIKKVPKGQYDILFKNAYALTDLIITKYDLGVKLRKAYQSGDKKQLEKLVDEVQLVIDKIPVFIETLRTQWMAENKPHGFDIQEYRIGGVLQRVKGCKQRLIDYLSGKIDSIPELEEKLLPDVLQGRNAVTGRQGYNSYELISSVNKF